MQYTRQEKTVATICDAIVNEHDEICSLFIKISEFNLKASIIFTKHFPNLYMKKTMSYEEVKVKKVYDDKVDLVVFKSGCLTNITVNYDDIDKLLVITQKNIVRKANPNVNRFGLMDLEEE